MTNVEARQALLDGKSINHEVFRKTLFFKLSADSIVHCNDGRSKYTLDDFFLAYDFDFLKQG